MRHARLPVDLGSITSKLFGEPSHTLSLLDPPNVGHKPVTNSTAGEPGKPNNVDGSTAPDAPTSTTTPITALPESEVRTNSVRSSAYCASVKVEPRGTLALIVGSEANGNGPCKFLVSADNVRLLSPVWAELVSKASMIVWRLGRRQIHLPDDDPDMMLLLMRVAHLKFNTVTLDLSFEQLLQLALICNRYECTEVLRPFHEKWSSLHREKILQPGFEQWMFVAYQFGYEEDYVRIANHLAMNCRVNPIGELLVPGSDTQKLEGHFPPNALQCIQFVRSKTLKCFLNTTYALANSMVNLNTCKAHSGPANPESSTASTNPSSLISDSERDECTLLNTGSFLRHLSTIGYWPAVQRISSVHDSLSEVADLLMHVRVITLKTYRSDSVMGEAGVEAETPMQRHEACNAGRMLAVKIREAMETMDRPVEYDTLEVIRKNANRWEAAEKRE
ncbi:hypothetical protein BDV95DRAFT_599183 [Massariosphaeria phaeospora]|uniref:BTB domain-containing protein n=1 Tax=Massariosphaeria phaeospora TaxID=100035 RepID=A0A7C8HZE6_9PLEO|nr:hypothetical protein BDV95DRAFT_599183 [Massariosphaeria phaeospora]